jgi:hypothetical protein
MNWILFFFAVLFLLAFLILLAHHLQFKRSIPTPSPFKSFLFINNYKIQGDNLMTKVPFNAESVNGAFGRPIDKFNNPTDVQAGTLKISSTDDSVLTVGPSETEPDNPYGYNAKFTGKAGAAQVTIEGDADLGEGVKTIGGAETFEVPAGEGVGFGPSTIGDFKMRDTANSGNAIPPPNTNAGESASNGNRSATSETGKGESDDQA